MSDIVAATASYEAWLGRHVDVDAGELAHKHTKMADAADPFPFFRGSYYRWAQTWEALGAPWHDAPPVLAVGDAHLENFGTWRDTEGRLCWGVNDFDEADELPYSYDLIRLATSARLARVGGLAVKPKFACDAILAGYRATFEAGGDAFVLEERHGELRALAMAQDGDPRDFWDKLTKRLNPAPADMPASAKKVLLQQLPAADLEVEFHARPKVGMGSLGKPRFVALATWAGGWVAREAKAVTPPATAWANSRSIPPRMAESVAAAVRSADPYYQPGREWVVRRLAPRCSRIELTNLTAATGLESLLTAMGAEVANVHLGRPKVANAIRKDLEHRPADWLSEAAKTFEQAVTSDWEAWRRG